MRWLAAVGLVVGAALAHAGATPDDVGDELIPTRVRVKLVGTTAHFDARFVFDVKGPLFGQERDLHFSLPPEGAITGATARAGSHVQRLQLDAIPAIDEVFDALSSRPGLGNDRRWAVRIDVQSSSHATIGVAAPHDARVTLDVTLEAPTCFFEDARHVLVAAPWLPRLARGVTVRTGADGLDDTCGQTSPAHDEDNKWIALPSTHLAKREAGEQRVGAIASRLALPGHHFARVELDLAGTLSSVPYDLHTVIVVDHSRSMNAKERESQRAIVAAYLRAAPRGRVQVIAYAREARALLPSWTVAAPAMTRIDRELRDMPPRNGSNIDAGLAAAATWLANVKGTRRVIVFTDERVARRLEHAQEPLRALLPENTLVHAVHPEPFGAHFMRTDDALLAPLARATGGFAVAGGVDDKSDIDALALARPISLDNIVIKGQGWEESPIDSRPCPSPLDNPLGEGRSCVWWAEGDAIAGPITMEGWLWGRRITRVLRPDPSHARTVARILSALREVSHELDELREPIDRAALAVNSVWSLFATWGKRGGYDQLEGFVGAGFMTSGCCSSSDDVGIGVGTAGIQSSLERELRPQLTNVVARCNPRTKVTLWVETTLEEIVDIEVTLYAHDAAAETCIREAAWDTSLAIANAPAYARTALSFQPL